MVLGGFIYLVGAGIAFWFFVLPLVLATLTWVDGGIFSVGWTFGGWSWAVGVFGGGIIMVIGQERRRKVRERTKNLGWGLSKIESDGEYQGRSEYLGEYWGESGESTGFKDTRICCPECGSHDLKSAGYGNRLECKNPKCGKIFT